jgi:predicted lipoprotein
MRHLLIAVALALPLPAFAQGAPEVNAPAIVAAALDRHILPGYARLTKETEDLAEAADRACAADDPGLGTAFHDAFDAWMGVHHLTFGPAEEENRHFALAFWPDARGMTPRSLLGLIEAADQVVDSAEDYATVSVAARGFYAMEFLLYDETLRAAGGPAYRCALVEAVARDIHATATDLRTAWERDFADLMRNAGRNDRFRSPEEALRTLFGALDQGLEVTADLRLGRPLGSFDRPRPLMAEARRSGRSLAQVVLSLEALEELALILSQDLPETQTALRDAFATALDRAATLDDPVLAGVADPQGRIRVEVLQQRVDEIRDIARAELGPALGVAAGFNALDGD